MGGWIGMGGLSVIGNVSGKKAFRVVDKESLLLSHLRS
jgi:hypothetical protein